VLYLGPPVLVEKHEIAVGDGNNGMEKVDRVLSGDLELSVLQKLTG